MRAAYFIFFVALLGSAPAAAQVGALQTDCKLGGPQDRRSYQFVATCAGRAPSPDRRFSIVQRAYTADQPPIELQDRHGRTITRIGQLRDDMPFAVLWAPNSQWFLVSHHVGSFMDRPEVYQISNRRVISRDRFRLIGQQLAQKIFPCLPRSKADWARGAVQGWSKDGRRVAWAFITQTDMCSPEYGGKSVSYEKNWKPVWMISEIPSGRVIPGSVHIDNSRSGLTLPRDHRYDEFR